MFINKTFAASSMATSAIATCVLWFMGVHDALHLAIQAAVFLGIAAGVHWTIEWYGLTLLKRMDESNTKAWAIHVNGVKVDEITDRAYAAMQRQVYGNVSLLLNQAWNVLRTAMVLGAFVAVIVPMCAFWLAFWIGMASQDDGTLESTLMLAMAARHELLITLTVAATGLALVNFFLMPSVFGFRNLYREDAHDKLRRFAKSAASGNVTLMPTIAATSNNPADKGSMSVAA